MHDGKKSFSISKMQKWGFLRAQRQVVCCGYMMHSSLLSGHKRQFEESFYECDDHHLSGNENGSSNNIIKFHLDSCKCPCSHDNTTDDNASYDSDDWSMYSSGEKTSSIDLDDEDDLVGPASEPASEEIDDLKQQCIDAINNKLAAFPNAVLDQQTINVQNG